MMPISLVSRQRLTATLARIETDLTGNILPFWMNQVFQADTRSFRDALDNELRPQTGHEHGALLISRILWTFSAAYRQYHDAALLDVAAAAYEDLLNRYRDSSYGGFVWSVSEAGEMAQDRKQVYGQAFAIYALSEYYAARGDTEALEEARALYHLLENYARDKRHGGYLEAFDRRWQSIDDVRLSEVDLNAPKSQNTLLHVMEAYTNLLRVWPDEGLRQSLHDLVVVMLERVIQPQSAHLGLFFSVDWKPLSDRISYGHDIEAAWLLTDAVSVLGDPVLLSRVQALALRIADVTLAEGVDKDGAVLYEGGPEGISNTNKEWWPQAEAVLGFLNAACISGEQRYLLAALRVWDFISAHLIDHQHGEWLRGIHRHGEPLAQALKVSFWKCPYHNGRMGLYARRYLLQLGAEQ